MELARAQFTTDKKRYTILDAPGHRTFVAEMIAGAAQADVGVLIISARQVGYRVFPDPLSPMLCWAHPSRLCAFAPGKRLKPLQLHCPREALGNGHTW